MNRLSDDLQASVAAGDITQTQAQNAISLLSAMGRAPGDYARLGSLETPSQALDRVAPQLDPGSVGRLMEWGQAAIGGGKARVLSAVALSPTKVAITFVRFVRESLLLAADAASPSNVELSSETEIEGTDI
jgi:hypothetical protein